MSIYAVSIWALKENSVSQTYGGFGTVIYKAFGALEAQTDIDAKGVAIEEAKTRWPQADGYIDYKCVIFELVDGWFGKRRLGEWG